MANFTPLLGASHDSSLCHTVDFSMKTVLEYRACVCVVKTDEKHSKTMTK